MQIIQSQRKLRSHVFETLPRDRTTGVSIGYTNTLADDRIKAAHIDEDDCAQGYFSITYHYLISPSGRIELGRNPMNRASRGREYIEQQESIWIGIVGGRNEGGKYVSTVTTDQRASIEWLIQALADALQTPLTITDYVENRTLRDQQYQHEKAIEAKEATLNGEKAAQIAMTA